ncbi:hypothetical protein DZA28_26795 [Pseudomonas alloputida]|uniref:Uncharacterized protein n=2 Tax=Pseudomonas TaxID=286 RepID=A0ABD6N5J5_9PSED|nr:hypothetical protein [Pseudomonas hunanensis]PTV56331.1 hypothetical protein DBL03_21390 [Pseudomonas putida]TRZ63344.1 hypothetical protein DZA28_26795 [Pseudomonas alloputida]
MWPVPASSRVNPLLQRPGSIPRCVYVVGAGLPAKRPEQTTSNVQANNSISPKCPPKGPKLRSTSRLCP